ncbi:MAG: hypothetical protein KAG37_11330 [Flavobacteriales bacterium]|nr:hypothetical protein [Flavobacteriales bacterium]
MKKITLFFFAVFASFAMSAQNGPAASGGAGDTGATHGLNIGLIGVSYEIPVASQITIAPAAFTNFDLDYLTLGVKANYYFDALFGLPAAWDVYAGANVGYGLWIGDGPNGSSELDLGLQVGGRWFWSDRWGLYVEIGGGKLGGGAYGLGVTMKM